VAETTTGSTLVPQTATGTEFYSPSRNISCEIDYGNGANSASCLTGNPPASVSLHPDGTLTRCSGDTCLANAGANTPTLDYGSTITLGPYTCLSEASGMKCTIPSGAGFLISKAGTTELS
jgi:hypothetical protein